jgi:hypothetical protein
VKTNTFAALGSLLTSLLLVERVLRVWPGTIPLGALAEFDPVMRSSIAGRRHLQRTADTVILPRDDGGPPDRLWVYKPRAEITYDFDEPGIVETVRMDDEGFCNVPSDAYGKAARFDVVAVGDSFTWCTTVHAEDAWPAVLARTSGMTTYNLGLPGRGPQEYLQTLRAFGIRKQPRIVVVDIYEGNDFRDSYRFHQWQSDARSAKTSAPCPFASAALCTAHRALARTALGTHSYAYNLLAGGIWHMAADARERAFDFRYDVQLPNGTVMPFNTRNGDLNEFEYAKRLGHGAADVDVFDDAMAGLAALAAAERFRVVLAYTPAAYTAYGARVRFHTGDIAETMKLYSLRQREYFKRKSAELGFEFADMTEPLVVAAEDAEQREPLYFRTNSHLTARGHAVIARALARNPIFNRPGA